MRTLRHLQPVLDEPGVLIVGSEVPNLLEPGAASTLVVSQDVDIAVPVDRVAAVKRRLRELGGLVPSTEEPSVYVPTSPALIEANFLGLPTHEGCERHVRTRGCRTPSHGLRTAPVAAARTHPDRRWDASAAATTGGSRRREAADRPVERKGVRDLLVVAGLLTVAKPEDLTEIVVVGRSLSVEARHALCSSLTVLSLMDRGAAMPDRCRYDRARRWRSSPRGSSAAARTINRPG